MRNPSDTFNFKLVSLPKKFHVGKRTCSPTVKDKKSDNANKGNINPIKIKIDAKEEDTIRNILKYKRSSIKNRKKIYRSQRNDTINNLANIKYETNKNINTEDKETEISFSIKLRGAKNNSCEEYLVKVFPYTKKWLIEQKAGCQETFQKCFETIIKESKDLNKLEEENAQIEGTEFSQVSTSAFGKRSSSTIKSDIGDMTKCYRKLPLPLQHGIQLIMPNRKRYTATKPHIQQTNFEPKDQNIKLLKDSISINSIENKQNSVKIMENYNNTQQDVDPEVKKKIIEGLIGENKNFEELKTIGDLVEIKTEENRKYIVQPKIKHESNKLEKIKRRIPMIIQGLRNIKPKSKDSSHITTLMQIKEIKCEEKSWSKKMLCSSPKNPTDSGKISAQNVTINCQEQKRKITVRQLSSSQLENKLNLTKGEEKPKIIKQMQKSRMFDTERKSIEPIKSKQPLINITQIEETRTTTLNYANISLRTYKSTKKPTSIKINHQDYTHLVDHPINKTINYINQFIALTFKSKENTINKMLICSLARALSLKLPAKKDLLEIQLFKSKETAFPMKESLLRKLWNVLNIENEVTQMETPPKQYKFYACKGNNGVMVKNVLKQRWWWNSVNKDDEGINLCWTQWCKKSFVRCLPTKKHLLTSNNVYPEVNTQPSNATQIKMCNHLENHFHLSNKKAMFINMQQILHSNETRSI